MYIFALIFMRRYQRYGCDAIALWMWHVWNAQCFTIYFQITFYHTILSSEMVPNVSFVVEKTLWNGFECIFKVFLFYSILMFFKMGLINPIFIFLLFMSDCLGHNKFNWKVSLFFHAQVHITVEFPILYKNVPVWGNGAQYNELQPLSRRATGYAGFFY